VSAGSIFPARQASIVAAAVAAAPLLLLQLASCAGAGGCGARGERAGFFFLTSHFSSTMGEAESFSRIAMSSSPSAAELKAQQQQQRPTSKRSRRFRICCGATVTLVLALVLVIVVLSQTLFKFRDPEVSIVSVKLETIHLVVDVITLSATLNLSVATDVRVANPNHYDFKYINSTVVMSYHGQLVGSPHFFLFAAFLPLPWKAGEYVFQLCFSRETLQAAEVICTFCLRRVHAVVKDYCNRRTSPSYQFDAEMQRLYLETERREAENLQRKACVAGSVFFTWSNPLQRIDFHICREVQM
jgi:hypothetical protein